MTETLVIKQSKKWYTSKTIWTNVIATGAMIVQAQLGFILPPEWQVVALSAVNMLLRKVTNTEVTW